MGGLLADGDIRLLVYTWSAFAQFPDNIGVVQVFFGDLCDEGAGLAFPVAGVAGSTSTDVFEPDDLAAFLHELEYC